MAHRNIATHFAPANNTLALMVRRESDDLVAKIILEQEALLPAGYISIIGNTYTPYQPQHIRIPAGRTVWFVQSGYPGLSYIVVEKPEGFSCSCKDARNGLPCPHTADVASYEAHCQEQEAEQALCLDMEWYKQEVAECTAAVRSMHRHEAEKIARIAESVGVPVSEVALIARVAATPEPIGPVEEAHAFIAWVRKDKAQKAECAA